MTETDKTTFMKTRSLITYSIALVFLAGTPLLCAQQDNGEPAPKDKPSQVSQLTLDDLRTFTDVFNQARRNYVESVDDKTLLDAAIRGMLLELDPHSSFLPASEYADLSDAAQGRYSGIGLDIQARDDRLVVRAIINDSPADQAGINPGDVITSIDGVPIAGRYLPDAMDDLLGKPGTEVVLTVLPPEGEERELTITRQYILLPTLRFELLEDSYGYFRITQFHRESAIHLEESLESIKSDGIDLKALVLDLRDNPGGTLRPAVSMADGFLDDGIIVTTRGRNSEMQLKFSAQAGQWLPGIPVMVLVDRGTASASEVLAGALQDNQRALIVGERTFGKGSVQSVLPLRNGDGIKLTTARYYTPSGRSIQAEGITPDVAIEWTEVPSPENNRIREADLDGHLEAEAEVVVDDSGEPSSLLADFPLKALLNALREAELVSY